MQVDEPGQKPKEKEHQSVQSQQEVIWLDGMMPRETAPRCPWLCLLGKTLHLFFH
jgi:hypothetical protein